MSCGSWATPFTADLVVQSARTIGAVATDGDVVYWSELRPEEGGRTQVVRLVPGGEPTDVLPAGANARTRVHEYGGGAWWVSAGTVWYVDWSDQRLRRIDPGGEPVVLTELAPEGGSVRWADGDVHPHDGRVVLVRETHPVAGRGAVDVVNEIVTLTADGEVEVLVSGPDFVSSPRWSPDGRSVAWHEWDHPSMPWDAARIKVSVDGEVTTVAGGPEEGVCQPRWAPDGSLWFCSDREDWWALYRWSADVGVRPMVDRPGDVGTPPWIFGLSRFGFLEGGEVVFAISHDGADTLALLDKEGVVTGLGVDCTSVPTVAVAGRTAVVVGASPTQESAVRRFRVSHGVADQVETLSPVRDLGVSPAWFARPEHVVFPGGDGRPTHANFYPPTNPGACPLDGELPPLIVTIHGGPTSQAVTTMSPGLQFWTSRGFAVVDVDYSGSTGYGRDYRNRLHGTWGVLDVGDCVAAVRWLAEQGRIDASRAVIRGGSAGGFTTLMALATSTVFAAGANYFGVADVERLALDTHKFESRYLDNLLAPYPEGREVYRARSPLTHVDSLRAPLVVFQGSEDAVVPPAQSELIVDALRHKGVPVAYRLYEGEQHGFRQAANIKDSLECELSFYSQVLGFDLPPEEGIARLEVENLEPGR